VKFGGKKPHIFRFSEKIFLRPFRSHLCGIKVKFYRGIEVKYGGKKPHIFRFSEKIFLRPFRGRLCGIKVKFYRAFPRLVPGLSK
jgi:hypothetical protein